MHASTPQQELKTASIGNAFIDFDANEITVGESTTSIEPLVIKVAAFLLTHAEQVISREELLKEVWGVTAGSDESLTRAISILRRELGKQTPNIDLIKTVPKRGYQWIGPCELVYNESKSIKAPFSASPMTQKNPTPSHTRKWDIGKVALIIAIVAFIQYQFFSPTTPQKAALTEKESIDRRIIKSAFGILIENNRPIDRAVVALVETRNYNDAITYLQNAYQSGEDAFSVSESIDVLHQIGALAFEPATRNSSGFLQRTSRY